MTPTETKWARAAILHATSAPSVKLNAYDSGLLVRYPQRFQTPAYREYLTIEALVADFPELASYPGRPDPIPA
jgi:hypothetical protein